MLFGEIIKETDLKAISGDASDYDVIDIVTSSQKAKEGVLFVCMIGVKSDGHNYAEDAYKRGCRLFLVQHEINLPSDATIYITSNTRIALAHISAAFFSYPAKELTLVGITGTKGKTTSSVLAARTMQALGEKTGYIGSNGIEYCGKHYSTLNTTPDSYTLNSTFRSMVSAGVTTVIMEVSSQAVLMHRIDGLSFDICVFTNLAHDHVGVGEHDTFEDYRDCKAKLFSDFGCRTMIYNPYDTASEYMLRNASAEHYYSTSASGNADFKATNIHSFRRGGMLGVDFTLNACGEECEASLSMAGDFNVENALNAIAVCVTLIKEKKTSCVFKNDQSIIKTICETVKNISVDGRCKVVESEYLKDRSFVIDYAHNGYSLANILRLLRTYCPRRLVCVFGSVGERSFDRREELGSVAAELADLSIITSDNPANEDPDIIINEIYNSFGDKKTKAVCITDRESAIEYAVKNSKPGDIILLAGKGHEEYQLVGNEKQPFSEERLVKKYIKTYFGNPILAQI